MWAKVEKHRWFYFGVSEHLKASFSWFTPNKGCVIKGPYKGMQYDGNDPNYDVFLSCK